MHRPMDCADGTLIMDRADGTADGGPPFPAHRHDVRTPMADHRSRHTGLMYEENRLLHLLVLEAILIILAKFVGLSFG